MKQGQAPLGRRATAWAVGLALAVLVMLPSTTLGIEAVEAPVADGCGELVEVPDTDRPYTRYEDMRSHPDPIAIRDERIEAAVAEARARGFEALLPTDDKGLGSVYRKLAGGGELLTYLSRAPLGARDTEVDLLEGGGVVIVETKGGKGHDVASVRRIYGDAAATILIGPYEGVLAHGDEIAPGLRSYGLYWTDGRTDWSVRSGHTDPRDMVELARSMVCAPTVDEPDAVVLAPIPELAGHWEKVPKAPWGAAYADVAVVDGGMLVMDRYGTRRMLRYHPESRRWHRPKKVPKRIETIGPSVWTGEEFVVFDEHREDRIVAYDPASDTWRSLPGSPLMGHDFAAVADGRIAVMHIEGSDGVDIDRSVAVLDLSDETWTELPPPAGRTTLIGLFGWDSGLITVSDDESRSLVHVESLDFEDRTWSEPKVVPVRSFHAQPVWAGDRLIWSGDDSVAGRADATYDPETLTVVDEDWHCPLSTGAALWTGELLIATNSTTALDPVTGDCYRIPGKDRTMGGSAAAAWIGDRVIYWSGGGAEEGQPDPYRRGGHAFLIVDAPPADRPGPLSALAGLVTSLPALLWPDAPAPASVAEFVPAVREQVWANASEGLRLPLHLRFIEARCSSDGGVALLFEEIGPPFLGRTYAYAVRGSMPTSKDDGWGGGYGMSSVLDDPEFIHLMGSDTVACP